MSTILIMFDVVNNKTIENVINLSKSKLPFRYLEKVSLQVFGLASGKSMFRILEPGYGVTNLITKNHDDFPGVFYDSRSMDFDKEKEDLSDEIDKLIHSGSYYIVNFLIPE